MQSHHPVASQIYSPTLESICPFLYIPSHISGEKSSCGEDGGRIVNKRESCSCLSVQKKASCCSARWPVYFVYDRPTSTLLTSYYTVALWEQSWGYLLAFVWVYLEEETSQWISNRRSPTLVVSPNSRGYLVCHSFSPHITLPGSHMSNLYKPHMHLPIETTP